MLIRQRNEAKKLYQRHKKVLMAIARMRATVRKEENRLMMLNSFFSQSTFIVLWLNDEKQQFLIAVQVKQ